MSWSRDDSGYAPSPDPAAAAERHFYEQSLMDGPDEPPWECQTCRDRGVIVESDHDPKCSESGGRLCASLCPVPHEYPCHDCGPRRYEHGVTVVGFTSLAGRVTSIDIRTESYDDHSLLTDDAMKVPAIRRALGRQHMPKWKDNNVAVTRFDVRDLTPSIEIDEQEVPF